LLLSEGECPFLSIEATSLDALEKCRSRIRENILAEEITRVSLSKKRACGIRRSEFVQQSIVSAQAT